MLGPYNSAQPAGLKVAASRSNTGDTLHTGKVVKLMDKASFPQCTDSVNRDVREALSTRRRPRVVEGREVSIKNALMHVTQLPCYLILFLSGGGGLRGPDVVCVSFIRSNRCPLSPDLCSATYFVP